MYRVQQLLPASCFVAGCHAVTVTVTVAAAAQCLRQGSARRLQRGFCLDLSRITARTREDGDVAASRPAGISR
jgi:hypothetical protein